MKFIRFLIVCGCLATPAFAYGQASVTPDVVLVPGDVIRITVWRKPELSGSFDIGADGTIRHPLYRAVNVSGAPFGTVVTRIGDLLNKFESAPDFVVDPFFRVAVGGEVRRPDLYTLPAGTTVGQAIALAGGLTDVGRMDKIQLTRAGTTRELNLMVPDARVATERVLSGDQLIVAKRTNKLRDYVAPIASVLGATALVIRSLFLR